MKRITPLFILLLLAGAPALSAQDSGAFRVAALRGATLHVKENRLDASWTPVAENTARFALTESRIAVLDRGGVLQVKQGAISAPWVREADGVRDFALDGERIAVLDRNNALQVKTGGLEAPWVQVATGVKNFSLRGRRILVLQYGALQVKQGALDAPWVREADNIVATDMSGHRLGALGKNGSLDVKEGALDAAWVRVAEGVQEFSLEKNRVGVLYRNGALDVKEGDLNAAWVRVAEGVRSFRLLGDRIAVLQRDSLRVKAGALDAPWVQAADGVQSVQLTGTLIAIQKRDGSLQAKQGGLDAPWVWLNDGVRDFQIIHTGARSVAADPYPGWQYDAGRGELTRTVILESAAPGLDETKNARTEIRFPDGFGYCRHSAGPNRRGGPGGIAIAVAEPGRLVFTAWSGRKPSGGWNEGGVEIPLTVTARDAEHGTAACDPLPATGSGCEEKRCRRFIDAGETDNGVCMDTLCGLDRDERICVYNLRDDDRTRWRAQAKACQRGR